MLVGALAIPAVRAHGGPEPALAPGDAIIEQVIDGDTIEVRLRSGRHRVRLLGVDAPESVAPATPVQCYGPEAAHALGELLPPGTAVGLAADIEERDHYGRLLAYVHRRHDGLFVNRWLVDQGYADAVSYEPNTTFQSTFAAAARAAEGSGRGLWAACDGPDQPLDPDQVPSS
ncbi:MAG: thermonuclease family protein [Actinomycetota bacterium]